MTFLVLVEGYISMLIGVSPTIKLCLFREEDKKKKCPFYEQQRFFPCSKKDLNNMSKKIKFMALFTNPIKNISDTSDQKQQH